MRNMRRLLAPLTILLSMATVSCSRTPSPEERARMLISSMTLEEKTTLMRYDAGAVEALGIQPYN